MSDGKSIIELSATAIPTLTVTLNGTSEASCVVASKAPRIRSAIASASRREVSGKMHANSSPPSRANKSVGRSWLVATRQKATRASSPAACPYWSFMLLNLSRSSRSKATGWRETPDLSMILAACWRNARRLGTPVSGSSNEDLLVSKGHTLLAEAAEQIRRAHAEQDGLEHDERKQFGLHRS